MDKFFVKIKSKIKFFIKLFFSKKIINFVLGIKNTYKMYLFKKKAIKYYLKAIQLKPKLIIARILNQDIAEKENNRIF